MRLRFLIIFLGLIVTLTGCSLFGKKKQPLAVSPKVEIRNKKIMKLFKSGSQALDSENYKKAAQDFHLILRQSPSSTLETVTNYNLALSYWGLKRCHVTAKYLRKVIKTANKQQKRLRTEALLRLSYAYECLKKNTLVISSLVDVRARRDVLPMEIGQAEVPARLAAAYLREKNRKTAKKYFLEAEKGLQKIAGQRNKAKDKQELLGRTLFLMGRMTEPKARKGGFVVDTNYITTLQGLQKYLLKSVELNHKSWSPRAADEILNAYDLILATEDKMKRVELATKNDLEQLEKQSLRQEFINAALVSIQKLKNAKFPSSDNIKIVSVLFEAIDKKKDLLVTSLADIRAKTRLTKEDKSRFGIKRKGRLVDVEKKKNNK